MKTKLLVSINSTEILYLENEKGILVPIAPICIALGLDTSEQFYLIKNHETLCSFLTNEKIKHDNIEFKEVACLPVKWVFGWLFTLRSEKTDNDMITIYNSFIDLVKL